MSIKATIPTLDSDKYAWVYNNKLLPGGIPAPITKLLKKLNAHAKA